MTNVDIITNAQTTAVQGDTQKVTGLSYFDRTTEQQYNVELDGIFVQIGLIPNSEFLADTLTLSATNEVIVDHYNQTSIAGLFAAGDVTHSAYKQIIIAMGSGATAALSAFDYLIRQPVEL